MTELQFYYYLFYYTFYYILFYLLYIQYITIDSSKFGATGCYLLIQIYSICCIKWILKCWVNTLVLC